MDTPIPEKISFTDLFDMEEIQRLQDLFSGATGVASLITLPDGTPISNPSNFTRFCKNIVRETEPGCKNCFHSDAVIGGVNLNGPNIKPCLSGGLWDASANIIVGGKHIANWLIGQVRNEHTDMQQMMSYADMIGANREDFFQAFEEVPYMSIEQFTKVSNLLYSFVNDLSEKAYNNFRLKIEIAEKQRTEEALRNTNAYLENLINYANAPIIVWDPQFRITRFNHAFEKLTGLLEADVTGKSIEILFPAELVNRSMELIRKTITGEHWESVEIEIIHCDTSRRTVLWNSATIFASDGKTPVATIAQGQEITGRKLIEKELRESESKYRILFDKSPDSYLIIKDGVFIDCNNATEIMMRGDLTRIIGQRPEALSPEYQPDGQKSAIAAAEKIEKALSDGSYSFEWVHTRFDGTDFFVDVSIASMLMDGETVLFTTWRNITERKQAEESLRLERLFVKSLLDSLPGIFYLYSYPDLQLKRWNNNYETLLGYNNGELDGRSIFEWRRPEVKEMVLKSIDTIIQTGHNTIEAPLFTKNGEPIPFILTGHKLEIQNQIFILGIGLDNTEQKRAEEAQRETNAYLENLINYANAPIIVWDTEFRITRFNHAFEFMTGLSEAEVLGRTLEILFPADQVEKSMNLIQRTLTGERWETVEIEIQHLDSTLKTVLWNSATIFASDGKTPLATIAQGKDITVRKKAEQEVLVKNEELLNLNATKDKFFSIIAHDLRSPFNSFLGLTHIMAEELPSLTMAEIQKIAVNMRNSATNLYRLLENLLQWSMLQQGAIPFNPESHSLLSVVNESIGMIIEPARDKNISIVCDISGKVQVFADSQYLQTVIRNLVSNAVKFTGKGGTVKINAFESEPAMITVSVRDTGIGMPPEILSKLFVLNENISRRGTEGESSTGLGLIICNDFILKQGGKIWAESELGSGSAFYFTLPAGENK